MITIKCEKGALDEEGELRVPLGRFTAVSPFFEAAFKHDSHERETGIIHVQFSKSDMAMLHEAINPTTARSFTFSDHKLKPLLQMSCFFEINYLKEETMKKCISYGVHGSPHHFGWKDTIDYLLYAEQRQLEPLVDSTIIFLAEHLFLLDEEACEKLSENSVRKILAKAAAEKQETTLKRAAGSDLADLAQELKKARPTFLTMYLEREAECLEHLDHLTSMSADLEIPKDYSHHL